MSRDEPTNDEEEILVYAEFEDSVNIEKYRTVHVLGIDGESPIIQMDETFFTGKYEDPLGTYMFFEVDHEPQREDPLFDKIPEKNLKYSTKTMKYLKMEHAYVTPKEGYNLQRAQEQEDIIQPINFKNMQEAIDTFKNNWDKVGVSQ